MKKSTKLQTKILVCFCIMSLLIFGEGITVNAYTSHSQAEAVAWANSQVGQVLDYDGVYGAQCVDLIAYYYQYLGNKTPGGNAINYTSNALPSGWTRVYSNYQPGDIAVWYANHSCSSCSTGQYGHIAIVTSATSSWINVVDQNGPTGNICATGTYPTSAIVCAIRPDFSESGTPVDGERIKNNAVENITDTTAKISANVSPAVNLTEAGFYLGLSPDSMQKVTENATASNIIYISYDLGTGKWCGALQKGTTYYYQIYAIAGGITYKSAVDSFTTTGDSTPPVISNVQVKDINVNGYTVTCEVTDNVGVAKVCFPTWTDANGQDDLYANWTETTIGSSDGGNTYSYRVNVWDHNNEGGRYTTHIYAYDNAGNYSYYPVIVDVIRDVPLESFSLNYAALNLNINQIQTLAVQSYVPADTTVDKTATWSSSDPSVASVDAQGAVRGLKQGTATITCTVSGKTQTCQVTVSNYVEQEYSAWVESLPSDVVANLRLYEVEQKTQYCSQTKSETVSTTPNLAGWSCSNEWWGDWQSCGADVTGNATTEVKTEQQYVKTQYYYDHWHNPSNGATSPVQYSGWTHENTGWLDNALTASGTSNAGGTKYTSSVALGSCGLKWFWYNEQKQDIYNTLYYYRVKYFQYYQWSGWSGWSDNAIQSSDTTNVQTRTVYRYRFLGTQITAQPASQTGDIGGKAYFTVEANGQGLSYQWQVSTDGGKTWKNSALPGNTTTQLSVDIYESRDGYCFRCVMRDTFGSEVISESAVLTANIPPVKLTGQTKDQTVEVGNTVKFNVAATGVGLSYQWQSSTDGGKTWKNSGMTGNKTATLLVEATESRSGYQFRCVVTDKRANTVTSSAVMLTVLGKAKITEQPQSQSVEAGITVKYTVGATGAGLTYQWQVSKDSGKTWSNSSMTGNKTATLSVVATEGRSGYQFRCVVTDKTAYSVTTNAASLTVLGDAKITEQPKSQSTEAGSTVKYTVGAAGAGLTYQWQVSKDGGKTWSNSSMTGNKTSTLVVGATEERSGYQFRCVVTDKKANSVTSSAATLTVLGNAKITEQPESQSAEEGATVKYTVGATGAGLTYQWQVSKDGGKTWSNSAMTGNKTTTLSVDVTEGRNGYQFRCVVTDKKANSVTSNAAVLIVLGDAKITEQPKSQSAEAGATVQYTVGATGVGLTYQWQVSKDGGKTWSNSAMTGNKTATLSVGAEAGRNGYQFRCQVTDAKGNSITSEAAVLEVVIAVQTLQETTEQYSTSVSGGDAQAN